MNGVDDGVYLVKDTEKVDFLLVVSVVLGGGGDKSCSMIKWSNTKVGQAGFSLHCILLKDMNISVQRFKAWWYHQIFNL